MKRYLKGDFFSKVALSTLFILQFSILALVFYQQSLMKFQGQEIESLQKNIQTISTEKLKSISRKEKSTSPELQFNKSEAMSLAQLENRLRNYFSEELSSQLKNISSSMKVSPSVASSLEDLSEEEKHEKRLRVEEAMNYSSITIDNALSAGIWTREDTQKLYEHVGDLPESKRQELRDKLYTAINRQEVILEGFPGL
ncbi:hypothetical protein [Marinibactrum halimedae]|uniref:Uncharacterized protein n=1 Tax=Marinibactrum halimedae TaxID=1444977 RepID=A0AA37WLY6_9GAMM|nr:hypothetical protein [Marinibactrum halimedae]MCD9460675.1 hypothetical protein [Marinibactrum halimedae]GLS24321.1 hypothetical protein GCM10007877_00320 [Marinibactrum halimedae]